MCKRIGHIALAYNLPQEAVVSELGDGSSPGASESDLKEKMINHIVDVCYAQATEGVKQWLMNKVEKEGVDILRSFLEVKLRFEITAVSKEDCIVEKS